MILFNIFIVLRYIPPLSCGSPGLPETKEGITEELRKQESLLGQLHSEVHARICTKDREEQLWEVQRIITQLKVFCLIKLWVKFLYTSDKFKSIK